MKYKSLSFHKSVLKEMKFIGIDAIIFSLCFAGVTIHSILRFPNNFMGMMISASLSGFLGIYLVIALTYKADPKIGKFRTEMIELYSKYRNGPLAYMLTIIYLIIVICVIVLTAESRAAFSLVGLLVFSGFNIAATFLLFLGIGYTTAWMKVKQIKS